MRKWTCPNGTWHNEITLYVQTIHNCFKFNSELWEGTMLLMENEVNLHIDLFLHLLKTVTLEFELTIFVIHKCQAHETLLGPIQWPKLSMELVKVFSFV